VPSSEEGELYGNFLLLPDPDAPVPASVKTPHAGPTSIIAGPSDVVRPAVLTANFENPSALASTVDFPVYQLGRIPDYLRPAGGYVERNADGRVTCALLSYLSYLPDLDLWASTVELSAAELFPSPFPLWPTRLRAGGPDEVVFEPEKVNFLPSPGVMTLSELGQRLWWVERGILYQFRAELQGSREQTTELVSALSVAAVRGA
jgi:hypothetical protein